MAPPSQKKRRVEDGMRGKTERPKKRFRKQYDYHSSEDESDAQQDFKPVSLEDSDEEETQTTVVEDSAQTLPEPESESDDSAQKQLPDNHDGSDEDEEEEEEDVDEDDDQLSEVS